MEPAELLRLFAETLDRLALRYRVTGSTASSVFGEPRFTNDIDIVVELEAEQIDQFCKAFPAPAFYVSESAVREAVAERRQFNVIHPASGLKVDVIIPKNTAFDHSRLSRVAWVSPASGNAISFATPEDVIVKKLEFYRDGGSEKHLRDITGVLKIRAGNVDVAYIAHWATQLDVLDIWNMVLARAKDS